MLNQGISLPLLLSLESLPRLLCRKAVLTLRRRFLDILRHKWSLILAFIGLPISKYLYFLHIRRLSIPLEPPIIPVMLLNIRLLEAHRPIIERRLVRWTKNIISLLIIRQFQVEVFHYLICSIHLSIANRNLLI